MNDLVLNTLKVQNSENICLSGGVFANVKLNQTIYEKTRKNIFVMPGMDDGGLSIGAALHVYEEKSGFQARENFDNVYFGPNYTDKEILFELKNLILNLKKIENIEQKIASYLHEGNIIGDLMDQWNGAQELWEIEVF